MNRIDKILADDEFRSISVMIKEQEYDRIYCRHSLGHALSVARIAYIINLEENLGMDKELIYATALLHDMVRYSKYEKEGMSHHAAGAIIAKDILERAGFDEDEVVLICEAIGKHKNYAEDDNTLAALLYRADKLSRNCFICEAEPGCYWPDSIKNKTVIH